MSIEFTPACELAKEIRGKSIGSREVMDFYSECTERLAVDFSAVVVRDSEGVRAAASSRLSNLMEPQEAIGNAPRHGLANIRARLYPAL